MDNKKVAFCSAAGFLFIFMFDYIYHGMLLAGMYAETAALWREPGMVQQLMPVALMGQLFIAVAAAIFFHFGYEGRGRREGMKYGLYFGILLAGMHFMWFAYMPLPFDLVAAWIVGDFVKGIGLGMLFAWLHDKPVTA